MDVSTPSLLFAGVCVRRRFAAFGARLNRIANVELREGDLFEPVAGDRFDLILANPPYVVSPETGLLFRDDGLPGDSFSEGLVRRGSGVIILRRRDGANWIRAEKLSSDLVLPADHHVARLIENQDYLAVHEGRALLDDRFRLEAGLGAVRRLLELGFVVPADD
jgi:hypothetical protein